MMKSRYGVKLTEDEREILTGIVKRGIGSAYRIKCNKFFPFSIILTVTLEKSWWIYQMYLPDTGHFPTQKKELTPIAKTPNPGVLRALIFVSLHWGLRLCVNDPLFDRKPWDYWHEQGVRKSVWHPRSGVMPMPGTWGIPGSIRAPIAIFRCRFRVFFKELSTATKDTVLKGYFSKITCLITILSCSLSGLLRALFLAHILHGFLRETACRCLWWPAIAITSENWRV